MGPTGVVCITIGQLEKQSTTGERYGRKGEPSSLEERWRYRIRNSIEAELRQVYLTGPEDEATAKH